MKISGDNFLLFRDVRISCKQCSFNCIELANAAKIGNQYNPDGYVWKPSKDMDKHIIETGHTTYDMNFISEKEELSA